MKIISKENYSFDKTIHVLNFIRTKEFGWDCLIDFLKNNEYNNLVLKLETFAAQVDRDRISKLSDVSLTHLDVDYESSVNTERDSLTDELERSDKEQETSPHPTTNDRTQRVIDMVSAESAPHSQKSHPDFDAFGLFYAVGMIISGFVDLIEEGEFWYA